VLIAFGSGHVNAGDTSGARWAPAVALDGALVVPSVSVDEAFAAVGAALGGRAVVVSRAVHASAALLANLEA